MSAAKQPMSSGRATSAGADRTSKAQSAQPRRAFPIPNSASCRFVKQHGVIQPIVVRPVKGVLIVTRSCNAAGAPRSWPASA
jgi:hypothetical protein